MGINGHLNITSGARTHQAKRSLGSRDYSAPRSGEIAVRQDNRFACVDSS